MRVAVGEAVPMPTLPVVPDILTPLGLKLATVNIRSFDPLERIIEPPTINAEEGDPIDIESAPGLMSKELSVISVPSVFLMTTP